MKKPSWGKEAMGVWLKVASAVETGGVGHRGGGGRRKGWIAWSRIVVNLRALDGDTRTTGK